MDTATAYADFLLAVTRWSKAEIRNASAESLVTLRRLGDPFSRFVLHFLAKNPHIQPIEFLEGSLHRILRLNASPPDGLELPLPLFADSFWAGFQQSAKAFVEAERGRVIEVRSRSTDLKRAQSALKVIGKRLRTTGAIVERSGSSELAAFLDVTGLTVSHSFHADDMGLSFVSGLRFPGDRIPRFRTSYCGLLGLAVQTHIVLDGARPSDFAVDLALEWRESLESFVRAWTSTGRVA